MVRVRFRVRARVRVSYPNPNPNPHPNPNPNPNSNPNPNQVSAHGTNPASAAMCNMRIVAIGCDEQGNVDMADLKTKAEKHKDKVKV